MDRVELENLDSLVGDYLSFRGFEVATPYEEERQRQQRRSDRTQAPHVEPGAVKERILGAFMAGDYPRILTLWDTHIIQALKDRSAQIAAEARTAEFYINLQCATFPFRSDVMKNAGTPGVAARAAARSMTIFKHYLESRGRQMMGNRDFAVYKNLHKIAFPPTHPSFSHLFHDKWVPMAKDAVLTFLDRFFDSSDLPEICQMYLGRVSGTRTGQSNDGGGGLDGAREVELKEAFKLREKKLMQFARSMFDLSKELLEAVGESRDRPMDEAFLSGFKQRFATFQEVLDPASLAEGNDRGPSNERDTGAKTRAPAGSQVGAPPGNNSPVGGQISSSSEHYSKPGYASTVPAMNEHVNPSLLNYDLIAGDLSHITAEAETFLLGSGADAGDGQARVVGENLRRGCSILQAMSRVFRRCMQLGGESSEEDDMVAMQMARSDILCMGGGRFDEAGETANRLGAVGGGPLISLITTLGKVVAESSGETAMGNEVLVDCSVFAIHLARFVASIVLTVPGDTYVARHGVLLTQALGDLLINVPLDDSFEGKRRKGLTSRQTWTATGLLALCFRTKQSQTALVRRGIVAWQANAFMSSRLSGADMMLHTFLLRAVCTNQDAQHALCSSPSVQRQTETLLTSLMELLVSKPSEAITPALKVNLAETLTLLIQEPELREVARSLDYKPKLLSTAKSLGHAGVEAITKLINTIDSTSSPQPLSSDARTSFNLEVLQFLCDKLLAALDADNTSHKDDRGRLGMYGSMSPHTTPRKDPTGESPADADMRSRPKLPRTPDGGGNPRYLDHSVDHVQGTDGGFGEENVDYLENPEAIPFAPAPYVSPKPLNGLTDGDDQEGWEENMDNLGRSQSEMEPGEYGDLLDDALGDDENGGEEDEDGGEGDGEVGEDGDENEDD